VAIGRGADEVTGLMQELQVSIFDVSDLSNPRLTHRYSFGGGFSTASPATGNRWLRGDGDHHAVSYFPSDGIFAIPIFSEEPAWWDPNGSATLFDVGQGGLQVFRIDVDAGFVPLGIIEHDMLVERSLQIGDRLYAISSGAVTVHELTNPSVQLGEVSIAADLGADPIALTMYQARIEAVSSRSSIGEAERPAPREEWISSTSPRLQFSPRARAAAFANLSAPSRLDVDLVQALALDSSTPVAAHDASTLDDASADTEANDDAAVDNVGQLKPLRSAFRPVASRVRT